MTKQNYYFTLGQSHIHSLNTNEGAILWDKDGIIKVIAINEEEARKFITSLIGDKWAFCYDDSNMKFEYYPYGIIKTFDI